MKSVKHATIRSVRAGAEKVSGWNRNMRSSADDGTRRGSRIARSMFLAVPAMATLGAFGTAMAQGLLAANFMVVNQPFTIKSDKVIGSGFAAFMHDRTVDNGATSKSEGMVRAGFKSAKLDGLCGVVHQTIVGVPFTLKITAGELVDGTPVGTEPEINASDLILEATGVEGSDSRFADMYLGKSADDVLMGGTSLVGGTPGAFGLEAGTVTVDRLNATAHTVELIGSIGLPGLKLAITGGTGSC